MRSLLGILFIATLASMSAMEAASLLILCAIVFVGFNKQLSHFHFKVFKHNLLSNALIFWFIFSGIGLGLALGVSEGGLYLLGEFRWVFNLFLLALLFIIIKLENKSVLFASSIYSVVCAYAVAGSLLSYDLVKQREVLPIEHMSISRAGGLFSNPMTLAHSYGVFVCLFLAVVLLIPRNEKTAKYLNLSWMAGVLGALTLFLTFTRGVWISVFFAVLFMLFLVRRRLAGFFTVGVAALFAALFTFWEDFRNRVLYAFHPESMDQIRINLWRANWEIFKDNPWFGLGWGQNTKALPEYFAKLGITDERFIMITHAHNQPLHMLAGTGILGFAGFVAFNTVMFMMSWKLWKMIPLAEAWHRALVLAAMGAQVHFWFGGLFEANFEHSKMRYAMSFAWGVILWLYHEYISSKANKASV